MYMFVVVQLGVVDRVPEVDKKFYQVLYQAHYARPSGHAYLQPIVKCPLKCSYQWLANTWDNDYNPINHLRWQL